MDRKVKERSGDQLIKIEGLSKHYDNLGNQIKILDKANLEIDKGDTLAVVGASGIGKSTLLHILGTLEKPDEGLFQFQDENVFEYSESALAKFRNNSIGFVFQFHYLLPEFTALENVMIPTLINGWNKKRSRQAAEEILIRLGLEKRISHRGSELSGGEQQRVALARSIILNPPLLLADEPTGNLDMRTSEKMHNLLLELNQERMMTMVVVTHNQEFAKLMSRIITIEDCHLIQAN